MFLTGFYNKSKTLNSFSMPIIAYNSARRANRVQYRCITLPKWENLGRMDILGGKRVEITNLGKAFSQLKRRAAEGGCVAYKLTAKLTHTIFLHKSIFLFLQFLKSKFIYPFFISLDCNKYIDIATL